MNQEQNDFLEKLYRTYFNEIKVHAYRFLSNWDDAHVAAQETFLLACEKVDMLSNHPNQIGWLKLTVRNTCYHMLRSRERQFLLFTSFDELTDKDIETATTNDKIVNPVEMLSGLITKDEEKLLKRIILDEASYVEVAEELGITMWACRKRVQRVIEKLRKKFK